MAQASSRRGPLGEFIRRRRVGSGLSLRDLSQLTKVSNAYLSQVERGLHQPSIRILRAIADALDVSSEQLLAEAGLAQNRADSAGRPDSTEEWTQPTSGRLPTPTERAIATDPRLDDDARKSLLVIYSRMAGVSPPLEL